jgi:chromosome segregation ATPase
MDEAVALESQRAELRQQLLQLKRATAFYRERVAHVASELDREQSNYTELLKRYEEQSVEVSKLRCEYEHWRSDVETKREELRRLRDELELVTGQWRRIQQLQALETQSLEENNRYLERLLTAVAVSIPMALVIEKQLRSKL